MPLSRLALILILLTLCTELGIGLWRHADPPPSQADVFSFPTAATAFNQSEAFATVVTKYGADRGAECKLAAEDGTPLTAFYFEWDRIEAGPVMNLAGHPPEQCNVALGYKLLGIDAPRTYQPAGQLPLSFDCTRFEDRSGRKMYVFKVAWLRRCFDRFEWLVWMDLDAIFVNPEIDLEVPLTLNST